MGQPASAGGILEVVVCLQIKMVEMF